MSVNAFGQNFPAPLVKVVDDDGTPSSTWAQFLQSLWNRTGQGNGIIPGVAVGLTATAGGQAGALALTKDWNDVGTVPGAGGVLIPPMNAGQDILIVNSGLNTLSVYPPIGKQIDALATNAPYALAINKMQLFRVFSATQIRSTQLG